MNVIILLGIVLWGLMRIYGGKNGHKTFISLIINLFTLFVFVFFLGTGLSPFLIAVIFTLFLISMNLFFINGFHTKTRLAFKGTLITLLLQTAFIYLTTYLLLTQGFSKEELFEMDTLDLNLPINFIHIQAAVILLSSGIAVSDTAISISSAMTELLYHEPDIQASHLFKSGLTIGRDIIGTTVNTLLFAFIGNSLALIIWISDLDYNIYELINHQAIVSELLLLVIGGVGIATVIPITAYLMSRLAKSS